MANEQILKYLQENSAYPRETLIVQLRTSGFPEEDIQAALSEMDGGAPIPPRPNPYSAQTTGSDDERIARVEARIAKRFKNHDALIKIFVVLGFLMLVALLALGINDHESGKTVTIFVTSVALFLYAVLGHQVTRGLSRSTQSNIRITIWMSVLLLFSGASGLLFLFILVDSIRTNSQLKKALESERIVIDDLPKKNTHIEKWHWLVLAPGAVSLIFVLL